MIKVINYLKTENGTAYKIQIDIEATLGAIVTPDILKRTTLESYIKAVVCDHISSLSITSE